MTTPCSADGCKRRAIYRVRAGCDTQGRVLCVPCTTALVGVADMRIDRLVPPKKEK